MIEAFQEMQKTRKAGKQESKGMDFSCLHAFLIFDLLHSTVKEKEVAPAK
jgi:hypothetical protein